MDGLNNLKTNKIKLKFKKPIARLSATNIMQNNSTTSLNGVTLASNMYSNPIRLEVNEYYDKIEMIFEETSLVNLSSYPPLPNHKRYFKIVFSCVDGKWNKSERIYGEKIESYFKFD